MGEQRRQAPGGNSTLTFSHMGAGPDDSTTAVSQRNKQGTRVSAPPPPDPAASLSANRFANGADQNCGNVMTGRSTTRVACAPGGMSSFSNLGFGAEPEQSVPGDSKIISANQFACGANQNCGNVMTGRSTTRLHAPPGGQSSIGVCLNSNIGRGDVPVARGSKEASVPISSIHPGRANPSSTRMMMPRGDSTGRQDNFNQEGESSFFPEAEQLAQFRARQEEQQELAQFRARQEEQQELAQFRTRQEQEGAQGGGSFSPSVGAVRRNMVQHDTNPAMEQFSEAEMQELMLRERHMMALRAEQEMEEAERMARGRGEEQAQPQVLKRREAEGNNRNVFLPEQKSMFSPVGTLPGDHQVHGTMSQLKQVVPPFATTGPDENTQPYSTTSGAQRDFHPRRLHQPNINITGGGYIPEGRENPNRRVGVVPPGGYSTFALG